jgi:hypothetical protein
MCIGHPIKLVFLAGRSVKIGDFEPLVHLSGVGGQGASFL